MNKYQEALDNQMYIIQELEQKTEFNFVSNLIESMGFDCTSSGLEVLQELVDRATPKKPILKISKWSGRGAHSCPVCDTVVYKSQCCSNNDCRQAIDWNK